MGDPTFTGGTLNFSALGVKISLVASADGGQGLCLVLVRAAPSATPTPPATPASHAPPS